MIDHWHVTSEATDPAVVAALLDDRPLAGDAVEHLRPACGRMVVSGICVVAGPVDGYLALALAVLGEREEATDLAKRADALASRWRMTAYLGWLAKHRRDLRF